MKAVFYYDTAMGRVGIAEADGAITHLFWPDRGTRTQAPAEAKLSETPVLQKAHMELTEYLDGKRRTFSFSFAPSGTDFQRSVWQALQTIPYGTTRSYGEIARQIQNPKACRAVGMANNRNPISIMIPCHRVIGANGSLVGYGGGLDVKAMLLKLEKNVLNR